MRSNVRVCRYGDKPALYDGDMILNTTSRSSDMGIAFSPFRLGPVTVTINGVDFVSKTMENAWQYTKVYREHVDMFGNYSEEWEPWRNEGFSNPRAVRYPMGKGRKPVYSFNGTKLNYVAARKALYIPLYRDAVAATWEFAVLQEAVHRGMFKTLWLRDFDGYDHIDKDKSLDTVINDPDMKMGHAFVLCGMLTGEI